MPPILTSPPRTDAMTARNKPRKRMKPVRAWAPIVDGRMWVKWIHTSRRGVIEDMNLRAAGYDYDVRPVEIREVHRGKR